MSQQASSILQKVIFLLFPLNVWVPALACQIHLLSPKCNSHICVDRKVSTRKNLPRFLTTIGVCVSEGEQNGVLNPVLALMKITALYHKVSPEKSLLLGALLGKVKLGTGKVEFQ